LAATGKIRVIGLAVALCVILLAAAAIRYRTAARASIAADTPALAASQTQWSGPIPSAYFGLTVLKFTQVIPSMHFGTTRSWDAGPGLDWSDSNPARNVYNFSRLDQFIAFSQKHGAEGIYTFGRTPRWASSQPNNPLSPYGPGQCAPPADISSWDAYVTAVVTHAAGRIKYWELWNEANEADYCGDIPSMVLMAQHAYRIIKKIDPTALVLSPSTDKVLGPQWLASFLSAGGAGAVDGIAFHGYWSTRAEDIVPVAASFHAAAEANGLANLPMWDTESSWAYTGTMPMPPITVQAGYIAKSFLLHWSAGVARSAWYAYDGAAPWGTLYTATEGETAAATAYSQTYRWMVGATMAAPCGEAGNHVWTCALTRPGGYAAQAVWISSSSAAVAVPKQYTEYLDLAGITHPIVDGTVTIGDEPILLQTRPLP